MAARTMIWLQNDLRIHDHAPLHHAAQQSSFIVPIYCIDPRKFATTSHGFPKTGTHRAQFLIESLIDLRTALKQLGSNLVIRSGKPEKLLPQLATELGLTHCFFHREVTSEETSVEEKLRQQLESQNIKCQRFWGSTLYHPHHLPFSITETPKFFTQFRRELEQKSIIEPSFPAPQQLPSITNLNCGEIPTLNQLNCPETSPSPLSLFSFKGGESAGKDRVQAYIWSHDCLQHYKETRNGMLNPNDASRFSPWLALGCLSPRYVYEEVRRYECNRIKNDSTYWLIFELIWRDYFRFICAKHGDRIFKIGGLQQINLPWKSDRAQFDQWASGQTGYPLIDANMRELIATGFMTNRGRQNVASFLTKNLGINWQMGAEWFESWLIDYDVCSNWGNWNYSSGIGNDARGFRLFNITKQSQDYDPQGQYLRHWLPELAQLPHTMIHTPWKLESLEQSLFNVNIGQDYPTPMVDLRESAQAQKQAYMIAMGN